MMKNDDYDITAILLGITIKPNETTKKVAFERMTARRAELLAADTNYKCIELSEYDLEGVAAAGLPYEKENIKQNSIIIKGEPL